MTIQNIAQRVAADAAYRAYIAKLSDIHRDYIDEATAAEIPEDQVGEVILNSLASLTAYFAVTFGLSQDDYVEGCAKEYAKSALVLRDIDAGGQ